MPTTITEVSTFSPTITVPVAGDDVQAANIQSVGQVLGNRTKYLNDQRVIDEALINGMIADGQMIVRNGWEIFQMQPGATTGWSQDSSPYYGAISCTPGGGDAPLYIPLPCQTGKVYDVFALVNQQGVPGASQSCHMQVTEINIDQTTNSGVSGYAPTNTGGFVFVLSQQPTLGTSTGLILVTLDAPTVGTSFRLFAVGIRIRETGA